MFKKISIGFLALVISVGISAPFNQAFACNEDLASLLYDCFDGCGEKTEVGHYACIMGCDFSQVLGDCPSDTGDLLGALRFYGFVRALDTKCDCGNGGLGKSAKKKCRKDMKKFKSTIKLLKKYGLIDTDFYSYFQTAIKDRKKNC